MSVSERRNGRPEFGAGGSVSQQEGNSAALQDHVRRAAENRMADARTPLRPHDDQICV